MKAQDGDLPHASALAASLDPGLLATAVQLLARFLWGYVLPAIAAGLTLKFLVPPAGLGFAGWVAHVGHRFPVVFLAASFAVYSAIARYWRFYLPGGRYASPLPAHLFAGENDAERLRQWSEIAQVSRVVYGAARAARGTGAGDATAVALEARLERLERAIASEDLEGAKTAAEEAQSLVKGNFRGRAANGGLVGAVALCLSVAAVLLVRAKVVEPYEVGSTSMMPTLAVDDRIAANKLAYLKSCGLPSRGDAIVFPTASVAMSGQVAPDTLVKRVIGLPGDRIEMSGGVPRINGWDVPSCTAGKLLDFVPGGTGEGLQETVRVEFLGDRAYLTLHGLTMPTMRGPYVVRPGEVFVLGDNRANSLDSRVWNDGLGGGLPTSAIQGRAQWFLVGTHRSGEADWSRLLRPLDGLERRIRAEGLNAEALAHGIERCMAERPAITSPPPPGRLQDLGGP